ncbi:hypothetical protein H8B09_07120 [Paenibacillus sp. PR3]|uniref:Uncharacterized protein n=1 Tax=Paenibacillus terricola TaxID=2763503 RepID=A0ABR8MRA3_9BACL|nr:hypothetical protein [Paenibacillus terricola]MBD3918521.1 hypothetical protein [Paenibacillus terricola]
MRKPFKQIAVAILFAMIATLIFDYCWTSKSEALQIAERYNAAESFKWEVSEINSERGHWIVHLTPVEQVKEAAWLYIDKWMGNIDHLTTTE